MKFIFHAVVVMVVSRIPPVNKDCGRGAAVPTRRRSCRGRNVMGRQLLIRGEVALDRIACGVVTCYSSSPTYPSYSSSPSVRTPVWRLLE